MWAALEADPGSLCYCKHAGNSSRQNQQHVIWLKTKVCATKTSDSDCINQLKMMKIMKNYFHSSIKLDSFTKCRFDVNTLCWICRPELPACLHEPGSTSCGRVNYSAKEEAYYFNHYCLQNDDLNNLS